MFGISYSNFLGKKSILKANTLIVPLILSTLVFAFFGVKGKTDINRLFPIFGYDIKSTIFSGIEHVYIFSGITYLMFLMPYLKNKKDFLKVSIISISLSILFMVFVSTLLLLTIPFVIDSNEIISVYLLSRIIELGTFFQRLDGIIINLWILSIFSYLSINLMFILDILSKMTNLKETNRISFSVSAIIFSIIMLLNKKDIVSFLDISVYKYSILFLVFGFSICILIFANIKLKQINDHLEEKCQKGE